MNPLFIFFLNLTARKIKYGLGEQEKKILKDILKNYNINITSENLSEFLYDMKTKLILMSLNIWIEQGRNVTIEKQIRGKTNENNTKIILNETLYSISVNSLDNTHLLHFHLLDNVDLSTIINDKIEIINTNYVYYSPNTSKINKIRLPFSNYNWFYKILDFLQEKKN